VLVVPTGNVHDPTDYITPHADSHQEFVRGMLASGNTTLLDPAPSALALTVGALGMDGVLKLGETVMGGPEAPSINTRRGPGVARGLKPEVAVPGGTMALNDTVGFADRRQLKRIVLSHEADALFAWEKGTSLAAPLVTRVATAVQAARPEASSPLIRALVLQAVAPTLIAEALLPDATPSDAERHRIHVVGHGQPTLDGARFSRRNRVVLFDQARLDVDKIVLYEVPIPASFFEPGAPPHRPTRTTGLTSRGHPWPLDNSDAISVVPPCCLLLKRARRSLPHRLPVTIASVVPHKPLARAIGRSTATHCRVPLARGVRSRREPTWTPP
jgi:hypothetical protein